MSIQAVGWALEQDVPARPKLVLVSIANHADHRTGYCWLKVETIADEAACSARAVYNFVGDLIRNGYIRKSLRKGDDGKQRASDYWILFDRVPTKWLKDRRPGDGDDEADAADDDAISSEPVAPGADGSEGENDAPPAAELPAGACGPQASTCNRKESVEEPSKTNPRKTESENRFAAPPRRYRPPPVEPVIHGDLHPDARKPIFVRMGTPAWDAHVKNGHPPTLHTTITIEGERRTGWSFPTLFPPGFTREKESAEVGTGSDPPSKKPA